MRALLAVDIKDHPEQLLARARKWVAPTDAFIDLLYVPPDLVTWSDYELDPIVMESVRHAHERERDDLAVKLGQYAAELGPHAGSARVSDPGRVVPTVLAAIDGHDLLIVGTHGRGLLGRLWMGSVAERLVREAPIPVLVLRGAPE